MGGKKIKGYTLVEFVAIIAIIMLLTAMAFVTMDIIKRRIRDARRLSDIQDIKTALLLYKQEVGYYPADIKAGESLKTPTGKVILAKVPVAPDEQDPNCSNPAYVYTQLNGGSNYNIRFCLSLDTDKYTRGECYATPKSHCEKIAAEGSKGPIVEPPATCSSSCEGLCGGTLNGCGTPCNDACVPEVATTKTWSKPESINDISGVYKDQMFKIKADSKGQVYLAYVDAGTNYLKILARSKADNWFEYGETSSYQQIKTNYLDFQIDKTTTDNKYFMLKDLGSDTPFPLIEQKSNGNFEFLYSSKWIDEYKGTESPTISGYKGMATIGSNIPAIDNLVGLGVMNDVATKEINTSVCSDSFKGIEGAFTNNPVETWYDTKTNDGSIFIAYIAEEGGGPLTVKRCDKQDKIYNIGEKISNNPITNFKVVDAGDYPIFVYYLSSQNCLAAKKYKDEKWSDLWGGGCHKINYSELYDVATNGSYLYLASASSGSVITEKYDLNTDKWVDKAINDFSDGGIYKKLSLEAYQNNLYIAYINSVTGNKVFFRAIEE